MRPLASSPGRPSWSFATDCRSRSDSAFTRSDIRLSSLPTCVARVSVETSDASAATLSSTGGTAGVCAIGGRAHRDRLPSRRPARRSAGTSGSIAERWRSFRRRRNEVAEARMPSTCDVSSGAAILDCPAVAASANVLRSLGQNVLKAACSRRGCRESRAGHRWSAGRSRDAGSPVPAMRPSAAWPAPTR